jgi:hypothetical protein
MKKLIIVSILLIPNLAFAVWWNPSTWNQKPKDLFPNTITPVATTTIIEKIVEVPTEKVVEKIVEKPVERVVTKTVTVDNPDLLKQISQLKARVAELEAQLSKISTPTSATSYSKVALCNNLKTELAQKTEAIQDLKAEEEYKVTQYRMTTFNITQEELDKYAAKIDTMYVDKRELLFRDLKLIQQNYNILCI